MQEVVSGSVLDTEQTTLRIVETDPEADPTTRHPHKHEEMEEVIYVLEGSGRAWEEGEVYDVSAGDAVLFPKGKRHMIANNTDEPLRLACFFPHPDIEQDFVKDTETTFPASEL